MTCNQCGKPAVAEVGGTPLCVDHALKWQQALDLDQARRATRMNHLLGLAEARVGLPGLFPRYEVPTPTIAAGPTTFNNIRVDRSNVGVINTGEVGKLNVALTQVRNSGDTRSADVLQRLTQAVVDEPGINADEKNELLQHLSFLAQQAAVPKDRRQASVGRTIVRALERLLGAAGNLASVWVAAKPALDALFS